MLLLFFVLKIKFFNYFKGVGSVLYYESFIAAVETNETSGIKWSLSPRNRKSENTQNHENWKTFIKKCFKFKENWNIQSWLLIA